MVGWETRASGRRTAATLPAVVVLIGASLLGSWLLDRRGAVLTVSVWWIVPVVAVPCWLAGYAVLARRRYARSLADRARLLDREQRTAVERAVDEERARIARELHDVVTHNVSVMVVQAGAVRELLPTAPGEVTDALVAVESSGREAMTELRHLLGVLAPAADGSTESDLAPQPSLRWLGQLVDRVAFAGLPVEVTVDGDPRPLPAGVDVTAYRIIQEALTNALNHAAGSRAEVSVRYAERYLRLEVVNTGPSVLSRGEPPSALERAVLNRDQPAGRGLLGLRERIALYGGQLDARRRLGGGYRVRARIPLDPL